MRNSTMRSGTAYTTEEPGKASLSPGGDTIPCTLREFLFYFTAFDLTRSSKMAVAAFDQTGDMDKASGIIELTFSETRKRDAAK